MRADPELSEPELADPSTDPNPEVAGSTNLAVRQLPPPVDVYEWIFDPSGERIAAPIEDPSTGAMICGVWAIETGVFERGDPSGPGDLCETWAVSEPTPLRSADNAFTAELTPTTKGSALMVRTVATNQLRKVQDYYTKDIVAFGWAPAGHQLATTDGTWLEVWDADTGTERQTVALGGYGQLRKVRLGWNLGGVVVASIHETDYACQVGDVVRSCRNHQPEDPRWAILQALSVFRLTTDGHEVAISRDEDRFTSFESIVLHSDPRLHWLAWDETTDGQTTVHVLGTDGRTSALSGLTESKSRP